ncbi:MAG TPA: M20/M25/M40 family metallo-hydrolase [Gemmatimonadaceae bacterium]|nr:M20/M25/M40 family metallo-hydrolase [Gemmatimonadaceae bacterium]
MRPIARRTFPLAAFLLAAVSPLAAQQPERLDYQMLGRIRDEGMQRSQVMDIVSWLADVKGPRLTGSPGFKAAGDWTIETLKKWGMSNVHYEPWSFGRGWSLERFSAHMIEPTIQPLIGYPKAWSPGTGGVVSGEVMQVMINAPADFEKYRGKLKGKIVLPQTERVVRMLEGDIVLKMGDKEVKEAETTPIPAAGGAARFTPPAVSAAQLNKFYVDEGVVAVLDRGADSDMSAGGSDMSWQTQRVDGGTIFVGSAGSRDASAVMPPQVTLAVEHYNRMIRILQRGVPVKVELDLRVKFHDEGATPNGFNIIAEIPGTDPKLKDEIVLIGGHFDSWHAGTGATDNATGSAAMMEALRILKTLGVQPRRTIRIGLWGAEEQGLLGSREYVKQHIADGTTLKPEHAKHSAYFNIDNGTGKIRGIWFQQNFGVQPVFQQWINPLADLGVTTLGPRSVSSTDHVAFDAAGIPGFQFIQERLEYNSRTHHSNMDVVDRVQRGDMMQMATVVAWFAYNASMRDEKLPRKAMPAPRVAQ